MKPNWKNQYSEWSDFDLTRYNMRNADRMPTEELRRKQFIRCTVIDIESDIKSSVGFCAAEWQRREASMHKNWYEWMVADGTLT